MIDFIGAIRALLAGGIGGAPTVYATGTQAAVVTTEHFLSSPNVAGTFTLVVDTVNMVVGDVLELRVYQMTITAGTSRRALLMTYYGAQPADELIRISLPIANALTDANALRFSLTQTFGAAGRNFPWSVLRT